MQDDEGLSDFSFSFGTFANALFESRGLGEGGCGDGLEVLGPEDDSIVVVLGLCDLVFWEVVVDSKIAEVVTQPQILILSPCDARDAASVTISTSTASGSRRRPFSMTINYLHQTLSTGLAPSRSSRNPRAFPRTTSVRREGSSRVLTTPHKRASSRDATRPFEQLLRSFCSLPVSSVRLPLPL